MTQKTDNYALWQWGTVGLVVITIGSLVVGIDQIRQFNNSCLGAGILLPQCYSDRLAEMTGQNWRAK